MASLSNHAEVAESVDASVSKTDEVTLVPVRSRPSVRKKRMSLTSSFSFLKLYSYRTFIQVISPIVPPFISFLTYPSQCQLYKNALRKFV